MPTTALTDVLTYLRRIHAIDQARDLTDCELLERFLDAREDAAFRVLVERHGPMVLGVCRRVLGDVHAADDAFQATFMILAQRGASIRKSVALSGWLFAVAQRVAKQAKRQTNSRIRRERRAQQMPLSEPFDELTWQELRGVIDEEIGRLPEKCRAPVVLCYLEGKTHDEAAQELRCPKRTLTSRLAKARDLLRRQLTKRGVALSATALASAFADKAWGAPVAVMLTINTVKAATCLAAGKTVAAGCLSLGAAALAADAAKTMVGINAKLLLAVLALAFGLGGAGLASYAVLTEQTQAANTKQAQKPAAAKVEMAGQKKQGLPVETDLYGDPLPEGAVARLGTLRFRQAADILAISFVANGKFLATVDDSSEGFCVFDAETGRKLQSFPTPHLKSYNCFFHDGSQSVTVEPIVPVFSSDGKLVVLKDKLIDPESGKELKRLDGWGVPIGFTRDNQTFAGVVWSNQADTMNLALDASKPKSEGANSIVESKVVFWDVATGKVLRSIPGVADAISPDGKTLVVSEYRTGPKGAVLLRDATTGKEIWRREGDQISSVSFAPGSKIIAVAADRGLIRLLDVATGKQLLQFEMDPGNYRKILFSPDGKLLASITMPKGTICLWDPSTGKLLKKIHADPLLLTHEWNFPTWAFSQDGSVLAAVGNKNKALRRWDTATGQEINPSTGHTGEVESLYFTPDGKTLFSSCFQCQLLEWDLATMRTRRQVSGWLQEMPETLIAIRKMAFSQDGKTVAHLNVNNATARQHEIHVFDAASQMEIREFRIPWKIFHDHLQINVSPDGKLLEGLGDSGIHLWDIATGKQLFHQEAVMCIAFSEDWKFLVCRQSDAFVLWNTETGKEIRRWPFKASFGTFGDGNHHDPEPFAMSPDGKLLAYVGHNLRGTSFDPQSVYLWALDTGKELEQIRLPKGGVKSLAFSPSGRVFGAAMEDNTQLGNGNVEYRHTIHLWEVVSGQEIRQIKSPHGAVKALAFSPDGRTLATGGQDSSILLWDLAAPARGANRKAAPLTVQDLEALWSDLAGDGPTADSAIWSLALAPKQSFALLQKRLDVTPAPTDQLAKLIAELDSDQFATRQAARQTLEGMGAAAEAALRKVLKGEPTLEVRMRVQQILEKRDKEVLRTLRAVEVVEHVGTTEARQILQTLASGSPNPRVAQAAGEALRRLGLRHNRQF